MNSIGLLKQDFRHWAQVEQLSADIGMLSLFFKNKAFRSVAYYRMRRSGLVLRIVQRILRILLPEQECLYIKTSQIGGGLYIQHGFATIITAESIGKNVWINQQVTIGYNGDKAPIIGDNVVIYAGAKVVGGVRVGNNVTIGANAVVTKDIPDNSVVGGVPAKILKMK